MESGKVKNNMQPDTLICNSANITYNKGYIALWLGDYSVPDTLDIENEILLKKDHFHVSLLCVKNLLESNPKIESDVIQHFCDFTKDNEITFAGFTGEFRVATRDERKSVVAMCIVTNLDKLIDYLSEKLGMPIEQQPAHVTMYTLQQNRGIGLNSRAELEETSQPISVSGTLVVGTAQQF